MSASVGKAWNIMFSFMVTEKYRKQEVISGLLESPNVRFDAVQTLNCLFQSTNYLTPNKVRLFTV